MPFFQKTLTRTVTVAPMYMGPTLQTYVIQQLKAEVEGTTMGHDGYIITVLTVEEKGLEHGIIDHFTGSVKYRIKFSALMFRPFKHEVMDAIVLNTTAIGFFGFAGPLKVFVSQTHMPPDMEFNNDDSTFTSAETGVKIKAGNSVRLRIIGSSELSGAYCALGTIDEPYLGLLT